MVSAVLMVVAVLESTLPSFKKSLLVLQTQDTETTMTVLTVKKFKTSLRDSNFQASLKI